jgi:DNA mismatch repair ATPase MutS
VQRVIFLYKAVKGSAGASFGLNVAMMAGLPHAVVSKASVIARKCKEKTRNSQEVYCSSRIQSDIQNRTTARQTDSERQIEDCDKALQAMKAIFDLQDLCTPDGLALQRTVASIVASETCANDRQQVVCSLDI